MQDSNNENNRLRWDCINEASTHMVYIKDISYKFYGVKANLKNGDIMLKYSHASVLNFSKE